MSKRSYKKKYNRPHTGSYTDKAFNGKKRKPAIPYNFVTVQGTCARHNFTSDPSRFIAKDTFNDAPAFGLIWINLINFYYDIFIFCDVGISEGN